jgi:hypothetical protein
LGWVVTASVYLKYDKDNDDDQAEKSQSS